MSCQNPHCTDPVCIGIDEAQEFIANEVSRGLWSVIAVGDNPIFAYTVGLHARGLPELIMSGLGAENAKQVINTCGALMLVDGPFKHGTQTDELANLPSVIIDVSEDTKRQKTTQAFNYYKRWDYKLQQIVMPDPEGLFPWDTGYCKKMAVMQDLLGNPPREKMN